MEPQKEISVVLCEHRFRCLDNSQFYLLKNTIRKQEITEHSVKVLSVSRMPLCF
jgi:hypothetical protein